MERIKGFGHPLKCKQGYSVSGWFICQEGKYSIYPGQGIKILTDNNDIVHIAYVKDTRARLPLTRELLTPVIPAQVIDSTFRSYVEETKKSGHKLFVLDNYEFLTAVLEHKYYALLYEKKELVMPVAVPKKLKVLVKGQKWLVTFSSPWKGSERLLPPSAGRKALILSQPCTYYSNVVAPLVTTIKRRIAGVIQLAELYSDGLMDLNVTFMGTKGEVGGLCLSKVPLLEHYLHRPPDTPSELKAIFLP